MPHPPAISRLRRFAKAAASGLFPERPRGVDATRDIGAILGRTTVRTVFDVGANVGQSTRQFLRAFPNAQIHAFEPSTSNFTVLKEAFGSKSRVGLHALALGAQPEQRLLSTAGNNTMYHLIDVAETAGAATECVECNTIDLVSARIGVSTIDYLKIDTEGHDLRVLQGASQMLRQGRIRAIQCECGMHPANEVHVPFEAVKAFLEPSGYRVFGFYNQVGEWRLRQPFLRMVDVVFINMASPLR